MFPQLFHLLHCQVDIATETNNGSFYFEPIIANNYCSKLNLDFPVKKLVARMAELITENPENLNVEDVMANVYLIYNIFQSMCF